MTDEASLEPDRECVFCEGPVTEEMQTAPVPYGDTGDQVDVTVPVITCDTCKEAWTDWRSEMLRHDAICAAMGLLSPADLIGLREFLNLDQAAACNLFGMPAKVLEDWESRRRWPDPVYSIYMKRVARSVGYRETIG